MKINELGKSLRELRKNNKLSQTKISKMLKVSLRTVQRIEKGADFSVVVFAKWLEICGYENSINKIVITNKDEKLQEKREIVAAECGTKQPNVA